MSDLTYKDKQTCAGFSAIKDPNDHPQISEHVNLIKALRDFDYVFMRKDPPVDENFMNALHLLSQAESEGANIINRPSALQKFNEKIFALRFSNWMPDSSVICKVEDFKQFKQKYSTIILKPLNGMGGESIYKFDESSTDHLEIFRSLTNNYQSMVMVQNFLPEIYDGDYRILIIHGKPFPIALARIPQGGSFKGNLAAGGIGEARELSDDQARVSTEIGKLLLEEGILFAGIDMIGNYLTEINITSPTGAREILSQTGKNPIKTLLQSI
jgi:Glutathione synthase/Ribosomal protein S6 modification enzyme (glutaminyl transferase)